MGVCKAFQYPAMGDIRCSSALAMSAGFEQKSTHGFLKSEDYSSHDATPSLSAKPRVRLFLSCSQNTLSEASETRHFKSDQDETVQNVDAGIPYPILG